jgi:hypothetical protein
MGENIRLIETSENVTDYICLSHCWGTTDMFKITRETISERMQCIRYNDLPKTFKDAAEITRELKKRYLWIDSLCIIQNDAQDWREEGFRMHEIYGNSYLTIAASRSKGSNDTSSQYHLAINSGTSHSRLMGGTYRTCVCDRRFIISTPLKLFPSLNGADLPGTNLVTAGTAFWSTRTLVGMHGNRGVRMWEC